MTATRRPGKSFTATFGNRAVSGAAGGGPARTTESLFESMLDARRIRFPGGHFEVVAGPGEAVPPLAGGDLLVRTSSGGGAPRVARISSAPALPEDFFREGVMVERGPAGLYVEVEGGRGAMARRIGDAAGRMAEGMLVLRPTESFKIAAIGSLQEESDSALEKKRAALVATITTDDLFWHDVPLSGGYRIRVCSPVMKDDLFIPVTQGEALSLARQFEVFPLSRAVMDQAHNVANKVDKQRTPDSLFDFVTYSKRLKDTLYMTQFGYALSSGAHKLWVASSRAAVVNYGFYIKRVRGEMVRCGPYLDPQYNVIQSLGARHNARHWDYSQLLQFMTSLRDSSGQRIDVRQALLDKHPAVWDEPQPPAAGSLP